MPTASGGVGCDKFATAQSSASSIQHVICVTNQTSFTALPATSAPIDNKPEAGSSVFSNIILSGFQSVVLVRL